jgi:hypothetical protein
VILPLAKSGVRDGCANKLKDIKEKERISTLGFIVIFLIATLANEHYIAKMTE